MPCNFQTASGFYPWQTTIKKEISTLLLILKNVIIFANIPELEENVEKLKLIPFMVVGSIPLVVVTWLLSYFLSLIIFKSYRRN